MWKAVLVGLCVPLLIVLVEINRLSECFIVNKTIGYKHYYGKEVGQDYKCYYYNMTYNINGKFVEQIFIKQESCPSYDNTIKLVNAIDGKSFYCSYNGHNILTITDLVIYLICVLTLVIPYTILLTIHLS